MMRAATGPTDVAVRHAETCDGALAGVEYSGTAEDWDGVSEWRCPACGRRYGRWSGRELRDGEIEPRYGPALAEEG